MKKLINSTFLITGATGMIGQNIVALLKKLNEENSLNIKIIAHARNNEKANKLFQDDDIVKLVCDISDISYDKEIDYIIHTAGVTGRQQAASWFSYDNYINGFRRNKKGSGFGSWKNVKGLVYLSTLEVYGDTGFSKEDKVENKGGFIDPTNVRSSYPESKRMCECMCAAYTKQYGVPTYIARLTSTFGYGVSYDDKRVFAQFARSIIENKNIVLKSTGETIRNYCDAEDAAMAF